MKVGAQVMRGFNASSWEETLDVAGYSRTVATAAELQGQRLPQPLVEPKTGEATADCHGRQHHAHAGAGRSAAQTRVGIRF